MRTFIISILLSSMFLASSAQSFPTNTKKEATSIAMVIYSNDGETVWNALRLANYSQNEGDTVQIFLMAKGVELDSLEYQGDQIKQQIDIFYQNGGKILACGTCLYSRNNANPKLCTISSMKELYEMIRNSKIVLTF
jgi:uncharacterized protein involved in oxidation of intracellular sulfur